ncbi:MAG: hypothetical protein ACTSRZ_18860 [Promethearchaeota archaeon]
MVFILDENELLEIKEEIEKEFPNDMALQQVHIARKLLAMEAKKKGIKYIDYIMSITKDIKTVQ